MPSDPIIGRRSARLSYSRAHGAKRHARLTSRRQETLSHLGTA